MNTSFLQFISSNHFALAAAGTAGIGICFFYWGVQRFARRHSPGRSPQINVSAATPGLTAISGTATGPRTLAAPISGERCYVYRTSIWQLYESVGKKEWRNVAEETGHHTFLIEDETGKLLVEPSGAKLDLRQNLRQEYGWPSSSSGQPPERTEDQPSNRETVPDAVSNFLARNGVTLDRPTRVEEHCLQPETPVSVTGTVTRNSAMPVDSLASLAEGSSSNRPNGAVGDSRRSPNPTPAGSPQQPEVIRLTGGTTPQSTAQMSQQAKIAAALAKAGLAQRDVWQTTGTNASGIASGTNGHSKPVQSLDSTSDATSTAAVAPAMTMAMTMTMSKGLNDSTFIISNHQPEPGISISWKSVALVLAGSTLASLGLYVLLFAHLR